MQFCTKLLENRGVTVTRVKGSPLDASFDFFPLKHPTSIKLDLKKPDHMAFLKKHYLPKVNIVLESFRPGVMERLGLGPKVVHEINPNIIYVRLSSYGQSSSASGFAHHDSNFVALSGFLNKFNKFG